MYKFITILIVGVLAINAAAIHIQNEEMMMNNNNERTIENSWRELKSHIPIDIMTCIKNMMTSIKEIMPQPFTNAIKHILLDIRIIKAFMPMALNQFIENTIANFITMMPKMMTTMENTIRMASTSMEHREHINNIREHITMIMTKAIPMIKNFGAITTSN